MPIRIVCACGRTTRVREELAGRKVRCPECKAVVSVPVPEAEPAEELLEALPAGPPEREEKRTGVQRAPRTAAPSRQPRSEEEDDEDRPRPARREDESYTLQKSAPERRAEIQEIALEARRNVRRQKEERPPPVAVEPGWFGSINAGVTGGLLMCVIAVVWLVVGLACGFLFYYPPILFVIGLVAVFKGLAGGE